MREIKFRGKTQKGEWVYGGISYDNGYDIELPNKEEFESTISVDENTIGQYTGLKDKNGVEIYEGDIVATKLNDKIISVGDVQFDCGVFGAEWTHHKEYKFMVGSWGQRHNLRRFDDDIIDNIEVIGNVTDNPELLKEIEK